MTTRVCKTCQLEKPLTDYVKRKERKNGYLSHCNSCRADQALMRNYGLTRQEHTDMLVRQGGRCAVCHDEATRLCVDHNHTTGAVRELLCHTCNAALGLMRESPLLLRNLAAYVERHQ